MFIIGDAMVESESYYLWSIICIIVPSDLYLLFIVLVLNWFLAYND